MIRSILVTGCGGPAGVNVIKAFRQTDISLKIYGLDNNALHLAHVKNLVDKAFYAPMKHDEKYINFLNKIITLFNIDLIIPQPDPEVKFLSDHRDELNTALFLPSKETIDICQDKGLTARIWNEHHISNVKSKIIRKRILCTHNDIEDAAKEFGGFPIWIRASKGAGGRASSKILNVDQGYHWCNYWWMRDEDIEFIAQPFLSGKNYAVSTLWLHGDCVAVQARERLEYIYPNLAPSGVTGTPAFAKTVCIPKLECRAIESIIAIDKDPHGLFSVDLMEQDGEYIPTEINAGRFFTTSLFFTTAAILYKMPRFNFHQMILKYYDNDKFTHQTLNEYLPNNLYWVRHIDCGEKLLTQDEMDKLYEVIP